MIRNEWNKINSEYLEVLDTEDLKLCPIVAGPVCETHRLGNLVDILLKPLIEKVKSSVRDDIEFLDYMPKTVPSNTLLVSFDVVNHYIITFSLIKQCILKFEEQQWRQNLRHICYTGSGLPRRKNVN